MIISSGTKNLRHLERKAQLSYTTISTRRITTLVSNSKIPFGVWTILRDWYKMIDCYLVSLNHFFADMAPKPISGYDVFYIDTLNSTISKFTPTTRLFKCASKLLSFWVSSILISLSSSMLVGIFLIAGSCSVSIFLEILWGRSILPLFFSIASSFYFQFFPAIVIFPPFLATLFAGVLIAVTVFQATFAERIERFFYMTFITDLCVHTSIVPDNTLFIGKEA